jgi:hypothetical protein
MLRHAICRSKVAVITFHSSEHVTAAIDEYDNFAIDDGDVSRPMRLVRYADYLRDPSCLLSVSVPSATIDEQMREACAALHRDISTAENGGSDEQQHVLPTGDQRDRRRVYIDYDQPNDRRKCQVRTLAVVSNYFHRQRTVVLGLGYALVTQEQVRMRRQIFDRRKRPTAFIFAFKVKPRFLGTQIMLTILLL